MRSVEAGFDEHVAPHLLLFRGKSINQKVSRFDIVQNIFLLKI